MKLQNVRKQKGLSQKQLAESSGVPLRTIQQWECGQRNIDGAALDRLCDICATLNCKIQDIIENDTLIKKLNNCT